MSVSGGLTAGKRDRGQNGDVVGSQAEGIRKHETSHGPGQSGLASAEGHSQRVSDEA